MDTQAITLEYQLLPELESFGTIRQLTGNLPISRLPQSSQDFCFDHGIDYQLELSNTGEGILLRGSASSSGHTECARCLEPAAFEVSGEVEAYYVLDSHRIAEEAHSDEFSAIGAGGVVDLAVPILAAVIYELPQVVLCREDCAGLCPTCGINLNLEKCACADLPDESNPFYKLLSQNEDQ